MSASKKGTEVAGMTRSLEFNERELYLLLHAVDEYARRSAHPNPVRSGELWELVEKLSTAGAYYVYPKPEEA